MKQILWKFQKSVKSTKFMPLEKSAPYSMPQLSSESQRLLGLLANFIMQNGVVLKTSSLVSYMILNIKAPVLFIFSRNGWLYKTVLIHLFTLKTVLRNVQ